MTKITSLIVLLLSVLTGYCQTTKVPMKNPIIDGYFADPSIVKQGDNYYIYATIDPWGGDELGVFETSDFVTFTPRHLNWPTKKACTSPTSNESKVWAPSVVKAPDGKFYMYVSVGSEVWAGVSDAPLGPWKNLKPDNSPLIPANMYRQYHMIDAECFIDPDTRGQVYLYWGSGLNWMNGHCFMVKLQPDMVSFATGVVDVTPPHYFEAPFMFKKNRTYYLMYSEGKAIDHTYKVRYSVGKSPLGPWEEGATSPILETSADSLTYGPGHHCIFTVKGQNYILYHRIFPQKESYVLRQLCLDSLNFDSKGTIRKVSTLGVINPLKR